MNSELSPSYPLRNLSSSPVEVNVMSFNLRYGTADDNANLWQYRRDMVFDFIRKSGADLIGLQEALHFQILEIIRAVPDYESVGVGRDDGAEKGEFSAILFRTSRFTLEQSNTFWLSGKPQVPGSITWGNVCPRIATWARFIEKLSGAAVLFFNTHLDHISQLSRELGIRLIVQSMKKVSHGDDVSLLTGDFNVGPENPIIDYLTKSRNISDAGTASPVAVPANFPPEICAVLPPATYTCGSIRQVMTELDRSEQDRLLFKDTFRASNRLFQTHDESKSIKVVEIGLNGVVIQDASPQPSQVISVPGEGTYHAFTGKKDGERIDFIFVRDDPRVQVVSSTIHRDNRDGRYLSDHFPVSSSLIIKL